MKTKVLLIIALVFSFSFINAQEKTSKEVQYEKTLKVIKQGKYKFIADRAHAKGGKSISLTSNPNFLIIDEEYAKAELPFFGEAYVANHSGRAGINFNGLVIDYNVKPNDKKNRVEIRFKVKSSTELYSCNLTVYYGGNADLSISSNTKSSIRYDGDISVFEE